MSWTVIESPLGPLTLIAREDALTGIAFGRWTGGPEEPSPLVEQAARELREYFAGERRMFSIPLDPEGTPFQRKVWDALREIPYGETASYRDIAVRIGSPKACRAVGMANSKNPIPIMIPCHRVIGAGGRLVGYAGGLDIKKALLELEGR